MTWNERIVDAGLRMGVLGALLASDALTTEALQPALRRAEQRIRRDPTLLHPRTGKPSPANGNDWRMLAIAVEELGQTELPADALDGVERLSFDGGDGIYMWLEAALARLLGLSDDALDTGGESDLYVVRSLDGLGALPRLSTLCLDAYGYADVPRSLRPLAGHPALRAIVLTGELTDHDALASCAALRLVATHTPLPEPVRTTLAARGVVSTALWRWEGNEIVAVAPASSVRESLVPPPLPRHLVAFRVEDLPPALCRDLPADADIRRCLFWVGPADATITAPLFAALPEPPTALADAGLGLVQRVATLLSRDPAFARDILGGARHSSGFHAGAAADVEAFLRADGVTLLPIAPHLAKVQLVEVRTAVGLPVTEATFRRVALDAEVRSWPLEALAPGLFAVARAWSEGAMASIVTSSGSSPLPASDAPLVVVRESLVLS